MATTVFPLASNYLHYNRPSPWLHQVQTSKPHVYRLVAVYPKHCPTYPTYDLRMTASTRSRSDLLNQRTDV